MQLLGMFGAAPASAHNAWLAPSLDPLRRNLHGRQRNALIDVNLVNGELLPNRFCVGMPATIRKWARTYAN
jgi:hypothetical protein